MPSIVTLNAIAECFRTDCISLGDIKKKNLLLNLGNHSPDIIITNLQIFFSLSRSFLLVAPWWLPCFHSWNIKMSVRIVGNVFLWLDKTRRFGAPNRIWRNIGTNPLIRDCTGKTRMNWIRRSRLKIVGIFHSVNSQVRKDRLFCCVSSFCHLLCVFAKSDPTEDESVLWKCLKTQVDAVRWIWKVRCKVVWMSA